MSKPKRVLDSGIKRQSIELPEHLFTDLRDAGGQYLKGASNVSMIRTGLELLTHAYRWWVELKAMGFDDSVGATDLVSQAMRLYRSVRMLQESGGKLLHEAEDGTITEVIIT